jgi:eukaryotic-like serine/threonine-protein kinase
VAYSTPNGDLNVINGDGTGAHKLASVGGVIGSISWSPDGGKIRFSENRALWEMNSGGSNIHQLLPGWNPSEPKCCGVWSPNGEFYAFLGPGSAGHESQIYVLDERRGIFRRTNNQPFQLTSGPVTWAIMYSARMGRNSSLPALLTLENWFGSTRNRINFSPFLGGISGDLVAFSKDGQSVAYVSFPDGILWRANRDGSDRVQICQ